VLKRGFFGRQVFEDEGANRALAPFQCNGRASRAPANGELRQDKNGTSLTVHQAHLWSSSLTPSQTHRTMVTIGSGG
jgi:hypothetical protein